MDTIGKLFHIEDTSEERWQVHSESLLPPILLEVHLYALVLHRISPAESSVVWSIYGAGGKLRPAPGPVLMNGVFVGLWKQAESSCPPPYGQAYTSPVAWGHSEHLPLLGCT